MNKIEELKNKIAEFEDSLNKAQEEAELYRELKIKYTEKLQVEIQKEECNNYSFMLGKYWKISKTDKANNYNLFIFVNNIYVDEDYIDDTYFKCESIEYCHNKENGQLLWYSYMKSHDYLSDTKYEIGCSFNPNSLIEITEKEFLTNKKV